MRPAEVISDTLFYRAPDGRIIFRPWGSKGSCYLVTESQRIARSRIQLAYYLVMLWVTVECVTSFGTGVLIFVVTPSLIVGNYILYWLFSRGLPKTAIPDNPSPEYLQQRIKANARNFGKPFLWSMLVLSTTMSVIGLLAGIVTGDYVTGILTGGFFGFCSFVFAKRIKSI